MNKLIVIVHMSVTTRKKALTKDYLLVLSVERDICINVCVVTAWSLYPHRAS